jgi:prephenate dehydrogenase
MEAALIGQVRVVGAGLLGASVGLRLRALGVDVIVRLGSPANLSLAIGDCGSQAAPARDTDNPRLVVGPCLRMSRRG